MLDAPPNAGNYDLILADPPWRYGFSLTNSRKVENHYTTMALEDICALPVGSWAADNCVLLLWTTAPKMMEAVGVAVCAFSFGKACHTVDDYSACQAYCYPTDIDQDARKTLGVCVCQGGE